MATPTAARSNNAHSPPKDPTIWAIFKLIPYLWPKGSIALKTRLSLALAFIFSAKAFAVVIPIFYKRAVDALSIEDPVKAIPLGIILAYGGARVSSLILFQLRDLVFEPVKQHAVRQASLHVFAHLHSLPLTFHLGRHSGGLARAINRGTNAIRALISSFLFNLFPTILEFILVLSVLSSSFTSGFAWTVAITVISYIIFTGLTTEWRIRQRRRLNEADQIANARSFDSLLNYETVKYFSNESLELERYDDALAEYEHIAIQHQQSLSLLNIGQSIIMASGLTLLMWMAARGIAHGNMTVGDFVLVNTYLMQLAQPLEVFGWVYRTARVHIVDLKHMFDLLDERSEVPDVPEAKPIHITEGKIQFKDVHFAYDPRRPILKGISFEVPAGKTIALVGPSGAGKSTIARLLFRFWDPTQGHILIDGQDIRSVTQVSLRKQIGIVPQDTVLFNDTLHYNLAYASPYSPPEAVEQAAQMAAIDRFVAQTPDRWDTVVGERGLKLSGGEKQRMAIARVFLKAPKIVVLDEATSALDTQTEKEIQSNLQEVARGRTTLIIAHRLSTIIDADEILVLAHGQVCERGRHIDLLRRNGLYAQMWSTQQDEAQLKGATSLSTAHPWTR